MLSPPKASPPARASNLLPDEGMYAVGFKAEPLLATTQLLLWPCVRIIYVRTMVMIFPNLIESYPSRKQIVLSHYKLVEEMGVAVLVIRG